MFVCLQVLVTFQSMAAACVSRLLNQRWRSIVSCQIQFCHSHVTQYEPGVKPSSRYYGQPAPTTHPHLVKKGQVTPGITLQEFQDRRCRLMEEIVKYTSTFPHKIEHHLVVITAGTKQYMSEKIPYVFHQNTDFLYMSGFQEPESILVLHTVPGQSLPHHKSTMFVRKRDPHTELWDGPLTGIDGAMHLLGVDDAYNFEELEKYLADFIQTKRNYAVWYDYSNPTNTEVHKVLKSLVTDGRQLFIETPRRLIQQMRLIKSHSERGLMKKSCEIASSAFMDVMLLSRAGISEQVLNAKMEYECKSRGASYLAYPSVVAGGNRANIIHYIHNNQKIEGDEMVLMDAGCYYHGYASDITRTWPVGGTFSDPQRVLYEVVLEVQSSLMQMCSPETSLDVLFSNACRLLGQKLQGIGLIAKSLSPQQLVQAAQEFCPHHVGHYLGMDVHDTALMSRNLKLSPGTVITVEPGIYIRETNLNVPKEFRGTGIRIEDNVLITDTGSLVLSEDCPKGVQELELLLSARELPKTERKFLDDAGV